MGIVYRFCLFFVLFFSQSTLWAQEAEANEEIPQLMDQALTDPQGYFFFADLDIRMVFVPANDDKFAMSEQGQWLPGERLFNLQSVNYGVVDSGVEYGTTVTDSEYVGEMAFFADPSTTSHPRVEKYSGQLSTEEIKGHQLKVSLDPSNPDIPLTFTLSGFKAGEDVVDLPMLGYDFVNPMDPNDFHSEQMDFETAAENDLVWTSLVPEFVETIESVYQYHQGLINDFHINPGRLEIDYASNNSNSEGLMCESMMAMVVCKVTFHVEGAIALPADRRLWNSPYMGDPKYQPTLANMVVQ